MRVLVTGGCGFIGSHQVVELLEAGHHVVIIDNESNSHGSVVVDRIEKITRQRPDYTRGDVRDAGLVARLLRDSGSEAIIHFAAFKHVAESVERPLAYYRNNIDGLASVLEAASSVGVKKLVFSSSGSVYGNANILPIPETAPHRPTNPYSATKSIGEQMLNDLCKSDPEWAVVALRYFNPAGAHPSGLLGEDPTGLLSNLLPILMHAAVGNLPGIKITGDDYPTPDGTGVRDYIHVVDVAIAHLRALGVLCSRSGFEAINIGRGVGISVRELHAAAEAATGRAIPVERQGRRPGDVAALYGDTNRATELLGPIRYRDAFEICADAWRWQTMNPNGFPEESGVGPIGL